MTKTDDNKKGWAIGAVVGVVAGFVTGLLTAPKSGKETRDDIKTKAEQLGSEAEKQLKRLYHDLVSLSDKVRIEAGNSAGKAKKQLEGLESKASEMRHRLGELLSTIRDGHIDESALKGVVKDTEKVLKDLRKVVK